MRRIEGVHWDRSCEEAERGSRRVPGVEDVNPIGRMNDIAVALISVSRGIRLAKSTSIAGCVLAFTTVIGTKE
jgi:hypothetical protein